MRTTQTIARSTRRPPPGSGTSPSTGAVARRVVALGMLLAWVPGVAAGQSVQEALAVPAGPRVEIAGERVRVAEERLAAAVRGLSADLVARPEIALGADVEDPAHVLPALSLQMGVTWVRDDAGVLAARAALVRAEAGLHDARRTEVKEALEAQGAYLRAALAARAAELDLAEARSQGVAAEAGGDPIDAAYASLTIRAAALDAADALADLRSSRAALARLGLSETPVFSPMRFALPAAIPTRAPRRSVLELELERAEALLARQRNFGVARDLSLAGRYESRTHRYQVDASVGLTDGRPTAALGAEYRPQQDDQWVVVLGARIAVNERTLADLADAERTVVRAQEDLAAFDDAFALEVAEALRLAELAEGRLAIALDMERVRRDELAALGSAGGATARAETAARRDLDRAYLAWLRYVEEVEDYLALVGAAWEVEGPLE